VCYVPFVGTWQAGISRSVRFFQEFCPMIYLFALLIGVVAGLRAMTAPAAVSWAAHLGWLPVDNTWAWFMGHWLTPWLFTALAVAELFNDQRPATASRKSPPQFGARLVTGALSGATIGAAVGLSLGGLIAGIIGAVIGTLGGYEARKRLVAATGGNDLPIALVEDAIAVFGALLIVSSVS
jgi:uncharacterized membrane protein